MAHKLTHVALHVRDLSECVAFYESFARLQVVHERGAGDSRVVWLAESKEAGLVLVFISAGPGRNQQAHDFSHLGFACDSRAAVEAIAGRAAAEGRLAWSVRDEPPPVGYYCGVRDPDGYIVEFSHGQDLRPG